MRRIALVGLLALAATAGCLALSPEDGEPATRVAPAQAGPTAGLVVTVTDPAVQPVAGANVTVEIPEGPANATAGPDGQARFDELDPGRAVVEADAPGHLARQTTVQLRAGEDATVRVTLPPSANTTVTERYVYEGRFECSATYLIVTGDCFAIARAAAEEAGQGDRLEPTTHRNVFDVPLHPGWTRANLTLDWDEPELTAGSMMRVNLEPVDPEDTEGHSQHYARAEGQAPVTVTVEPGANHPTASDGNLTPPEQGGTLRARVFHLGVEATHNPAGTELLGVGASVDQTFTLDVEVLYGR
jgi:hypothetical protein